MGRRWRRDMGSDFYGAGFLWGEMKILQNWLWWRLDNLLNILKTIELYTSKGWILWYVSYTSIKLSPEKVTADSSVTRERAEKPGAHWCFPSRQGKLPPTGWIWKRLWDTVENIAVFVHLTARYTRSCLRCLSKLPGTESCHNPVLIGWDIKWWKRVGKSNLMFNICIKSEEAGVLNRRLAEKDLVLVGPPCNSCWPLDVTAVKACSS